MKCLIFLLCTHRTYIAKSSTSWIDDYFAWFTSPGCCLIGSKPNEICEINGIFFNLITTYILIKLFDYVLE